MSRPEYGFPSATAVNGVFRSGAFRAIAIAAAVLALLSLAAVRRPLYARWLQAERAAKLAFLPAGYEAISDDDFIIYYPHGRRHEAEVVFGLADKYLKRLTAGMGYVPPVDRVTLVITPSRREMVSVLGSRYGYDALGAYWRGVIWLLSPGEWLDTGDPGWGTLYEKEGPVVHELTHLILSYRTAGNLPSWFDEGVAQYEEFKQTGYEWLEPGNTMNQRLYSLQELTKGFDRLENEALAYRQAFLLIRYLGERYGDGIIVDMAEDMARGRPALQALEDRTGLSLDRLEKNWRAWLGVRGQDLSGLRRRQSG